MRKFRIGDLTENTVSRASHQRRVQVLQEMVVWRKSCNLATHCVLTLACTSGVQSGYYVHTGPTQHPHLACNPCPHGPTEQHNRSRWVLTAKLQNVREERAHVVITWQQSDYGLVNQLLVMARCSCTQK